LHQRWQVTPQVAADVHVFFKRLHGSAYSECVSPACGTQRKFNTCLWLKQRAHAPPIPWMVAPVGPYDHQHVRRRYVTTGFGRDAGIRPVLVKLFEASKQPLPVRREPVAPINLVFGISSRRGLLLRRGGASVRRRTGVRSTGRRALHSRRTETGTRAFACERARCTRAPRSAVSACRVRARALARLAPSTAHRTRTEPPLTAPDAQRFLGTRPAHVERKDQRAAGTQQAHSTCTRALCGPKRPARLQRDWNGARGALEAEALARGLRAAARARARCFRVRAHEAASML
jgi:hypothetical protein